LRHQSSQFGDAFGQRLVCHHSDGNRLLEQGTCPGDSLALNLLVFSLLIFQQPEFAFGDGELLLKGKLIFSDRAQKIRTLNARFESPLPSNIQVFPYRGSTNCCPKVKK
jgi:hypothetical protein